jgi:hypothetical protein
VAKLAIKPGSTSQTVYVFVADSASTTGGGKTGIAFNAASFTAYYVRVAGSATSITLATQTVTGAFSSGGWVEVDATNMPGLYRFDVPDAAIAAGVRSVVVYFKGASGMAPTLLEIDLSNEAKADLDTIKTQAVTCSGGVTIPAATLASTTNITAATGIVLSGVTHTGAVIPTVTTTTTATNLTNLPSIPANWLTAAGIAASALNGKGDWNVGKTGYALTATTGLGNQTANITGNLSGSVGSVTGAVGSVTAAVTAGTVSDKTGYSLTATTGLGNQTANITGNLSGSVGSVTGAVGSVTGAVGSVTGAVGSVTGSVGSIGTGGIASTSFAAGAINAAAIATGAIDADALAADAGTEIGTAVWASTTRTLTSAGSGGATAQEVWEYATRTLTSAGAGGATAQEVWEYATRTLTSLGNGSGLSAIPWNAAWDAEVQSECADALVAYDPPTNTEMEARTLVAADYATATALAAVDTVVDAILDDTGTAGVVVASGSKTGYSLAAAGLDAIVVETGLNARQALSVNAAALAGVLSGAATTTVTVKGAGVATTRITATVDADGNRSAVTLALPS